MKTVINISIGMLWLSLASGSLALDGEETMVAASKRVISPYKAVFPGLSRTMPIKTSVDGPLLGNGDMAVCLSEIMVRKEGGKANQVANGPRFWLSKNDFWKLAHDYNIGPSGPRVFGGIDVKFPNLSGGSDTEQNLYDAVTVSRWAGDKSGAGVGVRSWVAASENMLVVELTASGRDVDVELDLWVQEGDNSEVAKSTESGLQWVTRKFAKDVVIDTEVACAMKILGATAPGAMVRQECLQRPWCDLSDRDRTQASPR